MQRQGVLSRTLWQVGPETGAHVDGEIVDYTVTDNSPAVGKMVRDLGLPEGATIALIARQEEFIPPQGKTILLSGDHVVVVIKGGAGEPVNRVFMPKAVAET